MHTEENTVYIWAAIKNSKFLVVQESVNERLPGGWFDTGDLG